MPAAGHVDMPEVLLHQVMMPSDMGPPPFKSRSKRSTAIPHASPSGTKKNIKCMRCVGKATHCCTFRLCLQSGWQSTEVRAQL